MSCTFFSCCQKDPCTTDSVDNLNPMKMTYKQLEKFTENFCEERLLGRGSSGVVHRGTLPDGKDIAVKVLNDMAALNDTGFNNEMKNLARLKHQNIVQLVGYCNESEKMNIKYEGRYVVAEKLYKALCFEYAENGNLHRFISDANKGLDWNIRYKIIKGICEGLRYLRVGLQEPIWHLDLKPENILLDKAMTPKITDFGMSRFASEETEMATMSALGTPGYIPPEFLKLQVISDSFDIFSLGVIITKLMIGQNHYHKYAALEHGEFVKHVQNIWKMRLREVVKPKSLDAYCQQVTICIDIASKCLNEDYRQRPHIKDIVNVLDETEIVIPNVPSEVEQFFLPNNGIIVTSSSGTSQHSANVRNPVVDQRLQSTLSKEFRLKFIQKITKNFSSEKLGVSVVGTVYKGTLPDGRIISVKELNKNASVADDKRFATEVTNLMALKHKNIAELVGFCQETPRTVTKKNGRRIIQNITERFICYEYLANGSLHKHLDDGTIDWDKRFNIIVGICQGLRFLHEEPTMGPLVHMNLVPNTIWLDSNWEPKITDIGFSRLFGQQQTRVTAVEVHGHRGYMAPEYLYRGDITTMSDIYSLGMLILEITAGQKIWDSNTYEAARNCVDKVQRDWMTDDQIKSKHPSLDSEGLLQVKTCVAIGLKCVDAEWIRRPCIVQIVDKLNGKCVPFFDEA